MAFKTKLRKIGNSLGVLIPRDVVTEYAEGDEIELKVITKDAISPDRDAAKNFGVITPKKKLEWCNKHHGWKCGCGCK